MGGSVDGKGIAVIRRDWREVGESLGEETENAHAAAAPLSARVVFSGRGGRLAGEFQQLIDGEGEHTEHQVRHDFAGSADADEARPELVFQAAVHALDHGA
jgi:hypothetical protein